jgi:hypothetical protein
LAGDWIKLEHATLDKPEVLELAELLTLSHGDALLLCLRFWIWADQQSRDGRRLSVSHSSLERLMKCPGFAAAMLKVGWLAEEDGQLFIPRFERHNGESSKKRVLKNERQSKWRESVDVRVDTSASTKASTREEKRIEEIKELKTLAPSDKSPSHAGAVNGEAVSFIPIVGNVEYGVSKSLLAELEAAYPQVDGPQTLKEIRAWCVTNPQKRKTARGLPRFINRWFERVQNNG